MGLLCAEGQVLLDNRSQSWSRSPGEGHGLKQGAGCGQGGDMKARAAQTGLILTLLSLCVSEGLPE